MMFRLGKIYASLDREKKDLFKKLANYFSKRFKGNQDSIFYDLTKEKKERLREIRFILTGERSLTNDSSQTLNTVGFTDMLSSFGGLRIGNDIEEGKGRRRRDASH